MFARVTMTQAHPEQLDDRIRFYQQGEADFRNQPGFFEAVLLVDRTSGRSMSISIWENEKALNRSIGMSRLISQRASGTFQGAPLRTNYEVLRHRPGRGKAAARVSTMRVKPDWFDRADIRRDTSIIDAASKQPGYSGFLVLGNRELNQVLGMSFWDSMEHLERSEGGSGYYQQEMERTRDQWAGGWKRDVYEVTAELWCPD